MPVYNGQMYIGEAIESVIAQTLQDWELIIIDDGSTDHTAEIIHGYDDRRIRYFHQVNMGRSAARNNALEMATGQYIVFLDADDLLMSTAIESNLKTLAKSNDCGVVYSDGYFCDRHGNPVARLSDYRTENATGAVIGYLLVEPVLNASNCAMVSRSIIVENGIRYEDSMICAEDWAFWAMVAGQTEFAYNPDITCKYRIHDSNTTFQHKQQCEMAKAMLRMRHLRSPFFDSVPMAKRIVFFYQVLFESFPDNPSKQVEIIDTPQFNSLDHISRGRILGLLAAHWLGNRTASKQMVQSMLDRAARANNKDKKTKILLMAFRLSPFMAQRMLQLWRGIGNSGSDEVNSMFDRVHLA